MEGIVGPTPHFTVGEVEARETKSTVSILKRKERQALLGAHSGPGAL